MNTANIFDELASLLFEAIPKSIASLKLAEPISCVRIRYFDTHAPCTYFTLYVISEKGRARVLAKDGADALHRLWSPTEDYRDKEVDLPLTPVRKPEHKAIKQACKQVYSLLSEDEGKYMVPFRRMLQKVARELNDKDWQATCPVTDDFVVAPADGSRHFADDYPDLAKSIPGPRLKMLRSRGLLGPGQNYDVRPGFEVEQSETGKQIEALAHEIEARAKALPTDKRIAYWIGEIDKTFKGEDCDKMRMRKLMAIGSPPDASPFYSICDLLDPLAAIGPKAAVPLANLGCEWAEKWEGRDHYTYMFELIRKLGEMSVATDEMERLLLQILDKELRRGLISVYGHVATALHKLFKKKYPEPEWNAKREWVNRDRFTQP